MDLHIVLGETEAVGGVSAKTREMNNMGTMRMRNFVVFGRELRNLLAIGT